MIETVEDIATPALEETIQRVAEKIRERNIEVVIVDDGDEARHAVLERLPKGAGSTQVSRRRCRMPVSSTRFMIRPNTTPRPRMLKMDRQTQAREIRLIAGPDFMLGSVNAVTESGVLVVASATASQLGPYAGTAGKVILVVGSQKIVPDLETALRRIREYVLPWEDAQVRKVVPTGSFVGKILIVEREWGNGRMTVILVRTPIGI
jgi:hypothetical protein